ncbi:MAG: hypothetical protein CL910_14355 [Deltaproteobacteria bacterium]|jgi:uncharacterized protein (DUF427 family)|nr:hypothetical protein [Deltaproteobacteria bacterium]
MASSPAYAEHPDHEVVIDPEPRFARVSFEGRAVAESQRARRLDESRCPPRIYLPREDVDFDLLEPTDHGTWCPFKGQASYHSLRLGDVVAENAVWSYEDPFDEVAEIRGHLAFYGEKVTIDSSD